MRPFALAAFGLIFLLVATPPAGAGTVYSMPTPAYLNNTFLIPVIGQDYDFVGSASGGGLTVTFSSQMQVRTVPDSWSTWGAPPYTEGDTPRVFDSFFDVFVELDLSHPVIKFGFEAEPTMFGSHTIEVRFFETNLLLQSILLDVEGSGGARLFGFGGPLINRVTISSGVESEGFAIARMRFEDVPEPATVVFLLSGGVLLSVLGFRRKRSN